MNISGDDFVIDSEMYKNISEDELVKKGMGLFGLLIASGCMKKEESDIMALEFFAPIYLLMTVCDREPDREPEAQRMLEKHIRLFSWKEIRHKDEGSIMFSLYCGK